MKGFKKALAVLCVVLMTATAFQVASAKAVSRDEWDYVVDEDGWVHGVFVMPYSPGPRQPMNSEVFYIDNVGGAWNEPIRISDSPEKSSYPQIDIDTELGIIYVTWLEDGPMNRPIWYAGSANGLVWTAPHPTGEVVNVIGNPSIEMTAEGGVIELSWRSHGSMVIVTDLDFDMISDYKDVQPFDFDVDIGMPFQADIVQYSSELGVVVALDFISGGGTVSIAPATPSILMSSSINNYFEVTLTGIASYLAVIKSVYDPTNLPGGIDESHLRMYWMSPDGWYILMGANESTGVNTNENYVWARLNHLSTFVIGDAAQWDSDNDTLSDAKEINIDNVSPTSQITTFKDGSSSITIDCQKDQTYTVNIGIPASLVATTVITNATFTMTHDFRLFNEKQVTLDENVGINYLAPGIYGDKIVYRSNKAGNDDIYLFNLTSNEETKISVSLGLDTMPKIWGDNVVWLNMNSGEGLDILLYNISTGNVSTIAGNCNAPDISGNYVVWGGGVQLYNISTGTTSTISSNNCGTPHVHGDYIAFNDYFAGGLMLYQISTSISRLVNEPSTNPFLIDVGERHVVYQDLNTNDLYAFEINQNVTTRITSTPSLTENNPAIFSNIVAWTDYRNGNADIYGFNLENGQMFPVCTALRNQMWPSVYLDKVVWQDARNGDYRIFMATPTNTSLDFFINGDNAPFWSADFSSATFYSPDFSANLNKYLMAHNDSDDGVNDGLVSIPISIKANKNGTIEIAQLMVNISNYQTDPLSSDTDKDGLSDNYEIMAITNPTQPTGTVNLPYRVVWVYPDRISTNVCFVPDTIRAQFLDTSAVISNVYGSNAILYPAIGCPEYVVKSIHRTLFFDCAYGTIGQLTLQKPGHTWITTAVSYSSMYDYLGRHILRGSVTLPTTIPVGLYDLFIYMSNTGVTSWVPHGVVVIDNYKIPFKFIQLTDIHIGQGTGDNGNVGDFLAILKTIYNLEGPEFIIITGDLTDTGYLNEFKYFKACLYQCNFPVFLTPGNHDYLTSGFQYYRSYLKPQSDRFYQGTGGNWDDYYFSYYTFGFIQFNSGDKVSSSYRLNGLTTIQLNWIKTAYSQLYGNGYTRSFVFSHGPIVGHNDDYTHTQNDGEFVDWVNGYPSGGSKNVEAYFCGHVHEHRIYYGDITWQNGNRNTMNNPRDKYVTDGYSYTASIVLSYTGSSYYIETDTACKEYP
jgi:beta propeller repeat protein